MADLIDSMMGFDPAEVLSGNSFEENSTTSFNQNIYKTNPAGKGIELASEDGHYHSRVRVLLNPFDVMKSIVHQARYAMNDEKGFFTAVSSLSIGDKKSCPIFSGFKKLRYAKTTDADGNTVEDSEKINWAKKYFDKSESDWVIVQIIEDENYPDLVGQFKVMKMPKVIMERLQAKMKPTDPSKPKQPLMDYIFGPALELNVVPGPDDPKQPSRKFREISYNLCDFETDPTPIICTDGTPLFTDSEIELIEEYNSLNNDFNKALADFNKAKTDSLKEKAKAKMETAEEGKQKLRDSVRGLYEKAVNYMKENAINLVDECGYKPWDAELTNRVNNWLDKVLAMKDPEISERKKDEMSNEFSQVEVNTDPGMEMTLGPTSENSDGLPF